MVGRSPHFRRRLACVTAAASAVLAFAPAGASAASCGPFTKVASNHAENIWAGPIPGFGWHGTYDITIESYLQRCGPNVTRARHQVYINTRRLPRGQTVAFNIWTRRSDGRWKIVKHQGTSFEVKGTQEIQETIVYQRRTTYPPARLTRVKMDYWVFDTAGSPRHSMKAVYGRFNGPEAGPAD